MSLIGNKSVLYKSPATFIGGGAVGLGMDRAGRNNPSQNRLRYVSENYPSLASTPMGTRADAAWIMPVKSGAMASVNEAVFGTTTSGLAYMGVTATGEAAYSIIFADATGELIVSGDGTTTFSITTNAPLLTASLAAIGATSIAITTNAPILGAEANLTAQSLYTITGSLTPYAIGNMIGSALPYTELSPQSLAAAVWDYVSRELTSTSSGTLSQQEHDQLMKSLTVSKFIALK